MHQVTRFQGFVVLLLVSISYVTLAEVITTEPDFTYGIFPKDFAWAAATAAYQVEGAWNVDGKGPSIWDEFVHKTPSLVDGHETGDVACDSYHLWQRDVEMAKELGINHYRFSISWSRVLPYGTPDHVNQVGVQYYKNLTQGLLNNGIQPMVTMYHWDLPQALHEKGGWLSPESVDWFGNYSDFCYKTFGDEVKFWLTLNEPLETAWDGYGTGNFAPGFNNNSGTDPYTVSKNLILSHARAWHTYHNNYFATQKGQVGLTFNSFFYEPFDDAPANVEAAERDMQFALGWFANPIFSADGDWPAVMKELVANKSLAAGLPQSRLPDFSPEEIAYVKGAGDFIGINYYSTRLVNDSKSSPINSNWSTDHDVAESVDSSWPVAASSWLYVVPWGLRKIMNWATNHYIDKPLYVFENGFSDSNGSLSDPLRVDFYRDHLNELLKAYLLDGCNVKGYTAWALMDNFEWDRAYGEKFGLYQVNFSDPMRTRTMKDSAKFYQEVIKNNGFPAPATTSSAHIATSTMSVPAPAPTSSAHIATSTMSVLSVIWLCCMVLTAFV